MTHVSIFWQFLHDAHAYKLKIGFNATLLLEPKPQVSLHPCD
jgi:xylose isomerase